eukprot:CAMPEP_0117766558 /NCGR_PEP_ID=MMETSP0947-20121206/20960_1 /TAXON_ID=44440 /ORGANISM="Chattonella subsalsa, Strain CCMP2191" /LENGTH=128 /DNA_ID=CAMNT_0005589789 /DNA_START=128 /DNA_END=511 /DNA_ORIENTATION=-
MVFVRLAGCLKSANLPVKERCLHLLSSITSRWNEELQTAETNEDKAIVQGLATRAHSMEEAVSKHLNVPRLHTVLLRRIRKEQREGRLFHSRFTEALLELVLSLADLRDCAVKCRVAASGSNDLVSDE